MLNINPIPAFNDNYLWLLDDPKTSKASIVDPGDAEPVLAYLKTHGLTLESILITHHHADHTGGVMKLLESFDVPVYGPDSPKIPMVTRPVKENDTIHVLGNEFSVIEIPGHTLEHIAYFHEGNKPLLFCGDTLFAGGCGRVFEGTHAMMHKSLLKLARLPKDTQVFCAHEYTLSNLAFAQTVEPENDSLNQRIKIARQTRENNKPTVPTTISLELSTNPFLRCTQPSIQTVAEYHSGKSLNSDDEVFGVIRQWKDNF